MSAPTRVFHLCSRAAAQQALAQGIYPSAGSASEGFIHLSQAHQVRGVLAAHYADTPDMVVLVLDPARLTAPLRYEGAAKMPGESDTAPAPAPGLFPHLYGPLDAGAVVQVVDAASFDAGQFGVEPR